jgi:hypothetical protein
MKESVAIAKDADAKKEYSSIRSGNSIHCVRNEPERQISSLRRVIGNITRNGSTPSVDSIATELSSMHTAGRASVLLALQRTHGNRYVQRVVAGIQAKLKVGQPGDVYEHEADRVADAVMRMPEPRVRQPEPRVRQPEKEEKEGLMQTPLAEQISPLVQRQVEEEEKEIIQSKEVSGQTPEVTLDIESDINSLRGGGWPLPDSVRAFYEPRFGHDFSQVRVHTDEKAAELARMINANAFTIGSNIVFEPGHYAPGTSTGKQLLAHELTHVVQQKQDPEPTVRRYTPAEYGRCQCLNWSLTRMFLTAEAMVTGGQFTGRPYASFFMDQFLHGVGLDQYVRFDDFKADAGGKSAFDDANASLSNEFLAEADGLPCGNSRSGVSKSATVSGHFAHGTDLFYAMGGFSLSAEGTGTVRKNCSDAGNCTGIEARVNIRYRVNDLYDWKADPGGCTPSTGETGCRANTKTVTLPVFGVICDECLNRLAIHGWATEFMVKVRGIANDYTISGPCGYRNPTTEPSVRDNQARDR